MKKFITTVAGMVIATIIALAPTGASAGSGHSGVFKGASDHITTGGVTIVKTAKGGHVVILDQDFTLDGAPDPRVGLGKSGTYDKATDLGKLQKIAGLQAYVIPAGVDVSKYNEVYIWCRKFSVPLGVATLN